jgi:hypothetical protein
MKHIPRFGCCLSSIAFPLFIALVAQPTFAQSEDPIPAVQERQQEPTEGRERGGADERPVGQMREMGMGQMGEMQGTMQSMDKMATTVTRAAEMCEMMMQKEMAMMPYKIGAGITVAVLLFIALILFIVLEIQRIIYWSRLLKQPH